MTASAFCARCWRIDTAEQIQRIVALYGILQLARKEVALLSKRWPFRLAYWIVALVGLSLTSLGPGYGIPKYVGLGIFVLALTILLFQQRPRKRRWLAVGAFFALTETGYLFLALWGNGMGFWLGLPFLLAGCLAAIFIPPRMQLWPKKEMPEAQA